MTLALDPRDVQREATMRGIDEIAAYLQETLGQQVTAYLSGLRDPKMVGRWAAARFAPRPTSSMRLRYGYQAARMLVDAYGTETAKAWFFGSNMHLDDEAPAFVLRYAEVPEDLRLLIPAARAFAGGAA